MKLAEIKPNTEYALRVPRKTNPRRVKVISIVPTEERFWNSVREVWVERSIRKVKVKFLDSPADRWDAPKGALLTVRASEIEAPWSEVGPGLRARLEENEERDKYAKALETRLKKLVGRNFDGYVTVSDLKRPSLHVSGKSFTKLLDLAEKGKA